MTPARRRQVWVVAFSMLILAIITTGEVGTYLASSLYLEQVAPGLFYSPYSPEAAEAIAGFEQYMAQRHPILGWPSPTSFGQGDFDASGSRYVPAFPVPGSTCVSLYGDSMTWGDEVDDEHAWGNILSRLLNCRVANYGVPGYGVDQAYLRFTTNEQDEA